MRQAKNITVLRRVQRGDVVTAELLNAIGGAVNQLSQAVSAPRQVTDAALNQSGSGVTDLNFTETSRTETTVEVTDSNGDTHDIEQIDQVVLANSSGDIMTLNFTN